MKQDTTKIKAIIDRFYCGEASQEEIALAVAYFKSEKDIAPEMSMDREIFLALHQPTEGIAVPKELERKVIEATVNKRKKPHILPWILSVSATAAVIAIIILTNPFNHNTSTPEMATATIVEVIEQTDSTPIDIEATNDAPHNESMAAEANAPTEESVMATPIKLKTKSKKRPSRAARTQKSNNQPKSTAKERAAAKLSIELINRALGKADIACTNAEETFMEIEQTLNK